MVLRVAFFLVMFAFYGNLYFQKLVVRKAVSACCVSHLQLQRL